MIDKKVLTAGVFDPVTKGHLSLFKKLSETYSEVIIGVFDNTEKTPMFDKKTRIKAVQTAVKDMKNVKVVNGKGLLADFVHHSDIDLIVKGYRDEKDLEYEKLQALYNYYRGGVETEFIKSEDEYKDISSTLVRKKIKSGQKYRHLLPDGVYELLPQ